MPLQLHQGRCGDRAPCPPRVHTECRGRVCALGRCWDRLPVFQAHSIDPWAAWVLLLKQNEKTVNDRKRSRDRAKNLEVS